MDEVVEALFLEKMTLRCFGRSALSCSAGIRAALIVGSLKLIKCGAEIKALKFEERRP